MLPVLLSQIMRGRLAVTGRAEEYRAHRLTWKDRSKLRASAAFCREGLVSVCGNWRRKRLFGFLSPRADFDVSLSDRDRPVPGRRTPAGDHRAPRAAHPLAGSP